MTPLEQKFRGGGGSNRKNHPWEGNGYFLESHIIRDFTVWDFKMWPLAVLTGDCINGFFFIRKCMAVLLGQENRGRNNEVIVSLRWK